MITTKEQAVERIAELLQLLDGLLTGADARRVESMAYQQKNPLRKDLLNGRTHVYYLSDSGLSRLCVNFETLNVFATYNSLPEVAHLWKHPTEEIARLTAELVTLLRTFWAEDAE